MKNKKGFTFVELLAVITIIGVLALILIPTIEKMTKESKDKVYQQQLNNIILSLKSWASDNRIYLPEEENETLIITLGNLKADGYIEYEVKNPLNDKCFDNSMALIITKVKKDYDYSIDLDTIIETNDCEIDVDAPIIALNGDMIENIEVNDIYVDKGAIAKDKNGNDITNNIVTTITGSGNVVDTSRIGNQYVITYSVTSNEKTAKISRTVKIVDTEAPELVIPGDVVLEPTTTSFDIMDGVSATDNSGEEIQVSSKSNIAFGVLGKYTVTYTATDSSGNTTKKNRLVTIKKVTNGIMSSDANCIKNNGSICPNGTLVSVQVNAVQSYDFYVVKDTGANLTLIMDRNLGKRVGWVSKVDYNDDTNYGTYGNNNKGPITALNYLNSQTVTWNNIEPIEEYIYDNNLNGTANTYGYQKLVVTNGTGVLTSQDGKTTTNLTGLVRARLLTYEEAETAKTNNGGNVPAYLYGNLSSSNTPEAPYGYWYLSAYPSNSINARKMYYYGDSGFNSGSIDSLIGVRPVIELSK